MLVLKQVSFIDTLLMLFGCSYLLLFTSEEVTNLLIDSTNLMSLVIFFKPKRLGLGLDKNQKINNILREFHSSVCFLSDRELERRLENLRSSNSLELSTETSENMKENLLKLKDEISRNNESNDVSDEIREVTDFLNTTKINNSNFSPGSIFQYNTY